MLIDIRALPRSRFAPWANAKTLPETMAAAGIRYQWLGDTLGGNPALLKDRKHKISIADFPGWDEKESYKQGISDLMDIASKYRTAIMCAEENPARCHRELLVGNTLRQRGIAIVHIRKNSKL
jgi:uncharacterized protein (DUF488 family)